MSHILIQRPHRLGSQEAMRRFSEVEINIKQHYGLHVEWDGTDGVFHGHGITGQVRVTEDHITIDMRLGFMLWPFTHRIREAIEHQMDQGLEL